MFAQPQPDVTVYTGAPICKPGDCTTLNAVYFDTGATTQYKVDEIPWSPPFKFDGTDGGAVESIKIDDIWSRVLDLPFKFCFYGQMYDKALINTNGAITFSIAGVVPGGQYQPSLPGDPTAIPPIPAVNSQAPWNLQGANPPAITNYSIFGVLQDTQPGDEPSIKNPVDHNILWSVKGAAPNRVLVFSIFNTKHFSCPDGNTMTSMMVLYETTNVIEVYIKDREFSTGCTWNEGRAAVGVRKDATTSLYAPGMNNINFTAHNRAMRFTPDGPSVVDIKWYDAANPTVSIGSGMPFEVCPTEPTTYIGRATYTMCDLSTYVVEDEVDVETVPFEFNDVDDVVICTDEPVATVDLTEINDQVLNGLDPDYYMLTLYATAEEAQIGWPPMSTAEMQNYVINQGEERTLYGRISDEIATGCRVYFEYKVKVSNYPTATEPVDIQKCDTDNSGSEVFDLTIRNAAILSALTPATDYAVTYHTTLPGANDNDLSIPDPTAYTSTGGTVFARVSNTKSTTCFDVTSLDLILTPTPQAVAPDDAFACSNVGYTLPVLATGNYFTAPGGAGTQLAANSTLYTSQTVYVFAASNSTPENCTSEDSFVVTIYPAPVVQELADVAACDGYELQPLTVGNYYTGPGGTGDLLPAGTIITETQTVYIHAVTGDATTVCTDDSDFVVTINNAPTIVEPTVLEACEVDNAGFATFDLTQRNAEVLNGQSGLTITWYPTLSDAQLNVNAIPDPSSHYSNSTVVYAGVVQEGTTTGCRSIVPLTLIVHPRPAVPVVSQLTLCDDNNSPDGIEEFDLTLNDDAARGGDASLTVQYYLTQADAQNNTSPITTPQNYPNATPNQQTIWVGVATTFGCRSVSSFTILVNPLPVLSTDPADFIATECEELPGEADFDLDEIATAVTAGSASYVVYFYQTEAQALAGGADFEPGPTYLSGDADIWARVINPTTNCVRVARVELNVIPAPIATTPAPIAECDDNNDGFARFNLVPTMQAIEAAIPDVTVSAFETQSDADLNVNAIPSPEAYDNIVAGTQTLYLRVQSDLTDCYDTVTLVLIVNPRPDAHSPAQPYALCDDGTSDTDGIAHFNLNSQSAEILAGLDPAQYTVDYYTDAAATPASLIGTPGNYPSATATVYAKVTNTATGCFYIVAVRLVVNALPVLITNEYSYSLCDTTLPANKETFDLTTTIDKFITDENLNGVAVTFHTTLADAQGGTNALTDAQAQAYENTSQVQSLYVRFTVTTTGCFRLGYLDIRVEPQPVLTLPSQDELTVCDTDGNGIGEFNLEALKETLANGDTSLVITFHLTAEEALSGANPIGNTTDYRNDHPGTQTLWVRAVSSTTGCFNTTPFPVTLIVTPAPQAPKLQDITLCDDTDNNGQDGALRTDLTVYETQIKEAVAPVEVTITYYLSKADADAGSNGIASPARHIARDGQVIWVRVENTAGCYSLTSFTIHINKPHQLVTPTPLAVCNEALPNDGIAEFDLTQKDDEILGPDGVGMDYVVDYFTTDPKTDSTAVAIADPKAYVNTDSNGAAQNPRTIWVRVTTTQGCVSYTTLTIRVLPLPVPNFNPAPLEVCDQDTTEVGSEPFDLTLAQDDIRNNGTNYLFSYYTTEEDAQAGTNAIPDPTSHNSASGSVWVRVEANTNNPSDLRCFQIVELELIVNPLPPIADLADYGICNDTPASPTAFNLKEYVETALGGNTGTIYTIGYFSDAALTTRATPITGYVVTGSATVYIEVVNNDTGCRIVKELELIVEQQAVANPVADPAAVCDTDDQNDGRASGWDLTLLAPEVLGAQDPAVFLVSYYDIDPSTVPAPQPIQDPENYTNQTPESQVIWIVVTNSDTVQDTPCSATTTVTLRVERRAEPVITTADGSDTVCIEWGASEGELELNSGVVPNGHTYLWYKDGVLLTDSDDSGSYIAKTGGVYTVVVTGPAPLECVSDESAGFTVIESGQASAIGQGYYVTNYFSDNQTITVTIEGNGEYTYQLDNGPRQESPVFTNVSPGYHTVTVWDEKTDFPCQELILNGVSIVDYPNFFTPNGDGFHDTWNIIGLSGTGSVIYIFDRYGKLIKQISPDLESSGWDGTLNGTPVPATDYWFTVTYPEFDGTTTVTKEFKSHFSLKR
ncbi:hypothetical protein AMR72_04690 [Flavobacterium psychrophilum]|nr:hypothetical protein AMR72_04690 [Flavobacterium psychrophilum]AOE51876.1 hypothetical protein ALW18_04685 [Flavobacterium psychrophilum]